MEYGDDKDDDNNDDGFGGDADYDAYDDDEVEVDNNENMDQRNTMTSFYLLTPVSP